MSTADPVARGPFAATYPVVLGEGPGFHDGSIQLVHTINGQAAPHIAPITVRDGEVVRLHNVNETGEYHPMHLHGHVFSVLARNGGPCRAALSTSTPSWLDHTRAGTSRSVPTTRGSGCFTATSCCTPASA